ncbi:hypothetical protein ACCT31_38880, partial [Rhizobium ruizarguesonis]
MADDAATPSPLQKALQAWLSNRHDAAHSEAVHKALEGVSSADAEALRSTNLTQSSRWIIGNDAWAYDAGMGGVH